ncbi:MAG: GDSL-type esterase/lipase family protein [Bacillota bacterium]
MRTSLAATTLILLSVASLSLADAPADVPAAAPSQPVIFDMETLRHQPGEFTRENQKIRAGTAELVEGKFGRAVKFSFAEGASGGFMTGRVQATADWDKTDGFSFWVKGDGSSTWGGIELIDRDNYALRYGYCFPIDSTEWRKIVVPWRDVIPELAGPLIDPQRGYAPSHLGSFFFGKWFYWREYPSQAYTIDQVMLERKIPHDAPPAAVEPGLQRLRTRLAQHQPITIVTLGDSLTDERHWANRKVVWHHLLAERLRAKYGVAVKVVNPAIGGTTLSQNMVLMPRWGKDAPSPDLVTIWFGGNDWDTGVRAERFSQYLRLAVDRIRRQTHGSADILLMTTCPAHGRWETMKELEQAVRDVAKDKQTGLADIAAEFRKAASADEALKQEYWAWDKVHLGGKGHALTEDVVFRAIDKP